MIRAAHACPTLPVREDLGSLRTLWRTQQTKIFSPLAAAAALVAAGAVAACGSSAASSASTSGTGGLASGTISMATSIATPADNWAVVPMSGDPASWEVFARAANSASWKLVTPPGVEDYGGLVASAGGANSLTVAVRPEQDRLFSPLAATSDGGSTWSTGGPINAAVAASPGAFAADGSHLAALLSDGTIETSSDAGATWSTMARPGAIAAASAARGCGGAVRVTALSFGITSSEVLAGGTCGTSGTTAIFSYSPGTGWQRLSLPLSGQLVRFADGMALVRSKSGLAALWHGTGWYAYAPLSGTPQPVPTNWEKSAPLPVSGGIIAAGTLPDAGAWVLLPGGRAATISALGTTAGGPQWLLLPPVPAKTAVLASGPNGATDALAVSGGTLTVWRLAAKATAWSKVQAISVPIQVGSSS
jgi:hypothetical protein